MTVTAMKAMKSHDAPLLHAKAWDHPQAPRLDVRTDNAQLSFSKNLDVALQTPRAMRRDRSLDKRTIVLITGTQTPIEQDEIWEKPKKKTLGD